MNVTPKEHRWDLPATKASDVDPNTVRPIETPQQILAVAGEWIGNHPVVCVSAALVAGIGLGCLIKRR